MGPVSILENNLRFGEEKYRGGCMVLNLPQALPLINVIGLLYIITLLLPGYREEETAMGGVAW
jgi:hypothetical protein